MFLNPWQPTNLLFLLLGLVVQMIPVILGTLIALAIARRWGWL